MSLGENIYKYRTAKRMSQGDLAEALEVSRQSVSKWENDAAVPELEKLVNMSRLFGVTLDGLVNGPSPSPESEDPAPDAPQAPGKRFSRRQRIGIAFWCFYALLVLALALSGEGLTGMLLGLPFLICGGMCYGSRLKHLSLWCTWVFVLPLILTPLHQFIYQPYAQLIMWTLWIGMFLLTLWTLRSDPVRFDKRCKLLLLLGYVLWFAYFVYTLLLLRFRTVDHLFPNNVWLTMWLDSGAYLLFTSLASISLRILKQEKADM